ncbi:MAG: hypothetical protein GX060_00160 [Firmicutes bacterium]|nr:hypothetical protein [Bacillota bacterium]
MDTISARNDQLAKKTPMQLCGDRPEKLRETDLFPPVRNFLERQGYTVQGEVEGCDVVAKKGDTLLIVELKLNFNTSLLVQATDRLRLTDLVYVALPQPTRRAWRQNWPGYQQLLRRLELGLMLVSFSMAVPRLEVVFDPQPFQQRRHSRRQQAVFQELAGRSGSYNLGGSTRRQLVTAYREAALLIAWHLAAAPGPLTPRALRQLGTSPETSRILYNNYYGWFHRVGHGLYEISEAGKQALVTYRDVIEYFAPPTSPGHAL